MPNDRWHFERAARAKGYAQVAGVDEAGRGPLAGPLVVAACIMPATFDVEGIDDSKKLSEKERERLFKRLQSDPNLLFAIEILSPQEVDRLNILQATFEGMRRALRGLPQAPDYALIDGKNLPDAPCCSEGIIKGDARSYSIGAASILAKVTRDRIMLELDRLYPNYGFKRHKGYGTAEHLKAIETYGPTPIHRMSFAPLKGRNLCFSV